MSTARDVVQTVSSLAAHVARDLFTSRRKFGFTRDWLRTNYRFIRQRPDIPTIDLLDVYPEIRDFVLPMEVHFSPWNLWPTELYLLCSLSRVIGARSIFEIGTYDGATTLQLALTNPEARIFTIDLCEQPHPNLRTGERFHNTPQADCITQFICNSTKFDYSPYFGQMDFVFIDGGHEYDTALADSSTAWKLARPGGVIVWDDYLKVESGSDVKRVVEELSRHWPVQHVRNTKFAMMIKPDEARPA